MKKSQIFLFLASMALLESAAEITALALKKPAQELPDDKDFDYYSANVCGKRFEDLYSFLSGENGAPVFTEEEIYNMLSVQSDYMNHRFDCSDFRAQLLFKIYKDYSGKLSERCAALIKNTFLNFKYFMDEPGDDSMCYWSENHQLLFAVAEYLAGQQWKNEIFINSGMSGEEHRKKAEIRINAWMQQRFKYGFSEYLSNNYLAEDLAPMANFIAYSEDRAAAEKMKIIMDILWLDVALNSAGNRLVAVSSRMYGNNKAGNFYGNSIAAAMNLLWGEESVKDVLSDSKISESEKAAITASLNKKPNHIVICFTDIVKKGIYTLPQAIKDIALSKESFVSKMGCGLSPDDLVEENLVGQQPHQIMAQLGAETFTNPQVIENTLKYLKNNKMFGNSFVSYFKFLSITALKPVNIKGFAERHNIMPHGIATGRGNVYTYRTAKYTLSTAVNKDVDRCGAQDHEWSANIGECLALFTTHPAGNGNNRFSSSPGYWIGNGRRPMSVQHENVNMTIYKIPKKLRLAETGISKITHTYMPVDFYDEFELNGNTVFARKNGVFVAMISNGELNFKPYDTEAVKGLFSNLKEELPARYVPQREFDLCREGGEYHIYITELSDCDKETYDEFKARIKTNKAHFSGNSVSYSTYFGSISASYSGEFKVNGADEPAVFDRYDSKFCHAKRKSNTICVDSGKNTLELHFDTAKRKTAE
ncbi:MAG: hypothetical protein MJ177_03350 [Clostridia bacterium]|nr:hypothetical protein [Clostridia bacterium]